MQADTVLLVPIYDEKISKYFHTRFLHRARPMILFEERQRDENIVLLFYRCYRVFNVYLE